ncbi:hypothetical protein PAGU2595_003540 [Lysobacter xanthus]
MNRFVISVASVACAALCIAPAVADPSSTATLPGGRVEAEINVEGAVIRYDGVLSESNTARFVRALNAQPNVTTLQVRSRGGDAIPALRMGEAVRARDLTVVVDRACNSGCANYLFTPARQRRILPGSEVIWHNKCPQNTGADTPYERVLAGQVGNVGGVLKRGGADVSPDERDRLLHARGDELARKLRIYVQEWATLHQRFFAASDVDARIVCLGDYVELPLQGAYGYALSQQDMEAFGLCGIDMPADYEAGVARALEEEGKASVAGVIRLADFPALHPSPRRACATPSALGIR